MHNPRMIFQEQVEFTQLSYILSWLDNNIKNKLERNSNMSNTFFSQSHYFEECHILLAQYILSLSTFVLIIFKYSESSQTFFIYFY